MHMITGGELSIIWITLAKLAANQTKSTGRRSPPALPAGGMLTALALGSSTLRKSGRCGIAAD